jgi:hypothetical protein
MNTTTLRIVGSTTFFFLLGLLPCFAQNESQRASINSSIGDDGTGTITVEARGHLPEPTVFYTASAIATAHVSPERIEQSIQLTIKVIQGKPKSLSVGLNGDDEVTAIEGANLQSWSVRREKTQRFLDLQLNEGTTELKTEIKLRSNKLSLPSTNELGHLTPGAAVAFDSIVTVNFASSVKGYVTLADGFVPLSNGEPTESNKPNRFQTTTGGRIQLAIGRDGTSPAPVELVDSTLQGERQSNGKSIRFQLRSTAQVSEANAEVVILSGNAAVKEIPNDTNYRLRLSTDGTRPVYKLVFSKVGTFPIVLDFVATLVTPDANSHGTDFTIAASAIVPLTISGLEKELVFHRDQESVVPQRRDDHWLGFLPATGRAKLQWKSARKTGEGKLFFTTTGRVEAKIGTGLLRQDHKIDYQVLQGELKSLSIVLRGPGEILEVHGTNMVAWKVSDKGDDRQLDITLSQPITTTSQFNVRSQTPLDAFPIRVEGLRLIPLGAIRHSGYLRLANFGSVRIEPAELVGLSQLAPDQFPGESIEARQVYVYRFPAADHAFTVAADRIQPEVNISELVLYQLAEADRVIRSDIELDIREAPIREWEFRVPSDYSVVSVTGASVVDYIAATEITEGRRSLKVIFGQDVTGRQLVSLHLEKSQEAAAGNWVLPRIEFPNAKTVRGDIGIVGAPGFRIATGESTLLVEKPLSYFPKPIPDLQQAFRIREPLWSATMHIELLDRSIQSDVFHLYSLSEETVFGSALINYFVTGSPVTEWKIMVPAALGNVIVDGQDVRTWRREGDTLTVTLHQPVMGAYTLLVTFEEKPDKTKGSFLAGQVTPIGVQGERGYIQVVSPMQVEINTTSISADMLKLDPLELPAEFRLLSTAPALGTWQYTERPFDLNLKVNWFEPGTAVVQVVEFAEANSRVSKDGEIVTDVLYFIKSRGQRTLKIQLPAAPVRLWEVWVNNHPATARKSNDATLIPLPGGTDPNVPIEVRLRLGKPTVRESSPELMLPVVFAPVLKTQWNVVGDEKRVLVPRGGTVKPPVPVLRPSGFDWVVKRGIIPLVLISLLSGIGIWFSSKSGLTPFRIQVGLLGLVIAIGVSVWAALEAYAETGIPSPLQLTVPILSIGETIQLRVNNTPLWRVNLSSFGLTWIVGGVMAILWTFMKKELRQRMLVRGAGIFFIALGVLMQGDGAPWFYAMLGAAITLFFFVPRARIGMENYRDWRRKNADQRREKQNDEEAPPSPDISPVTSAMLLLALALSSSSASLAATPKGFEAADSIKQEWQITHRDARLVASGTLTLSGKPGDRFLLLRSPAVLTRFDGEGLRLTKSEVPGMGLTYVISIPVADEPVQAEERLPSGDQPDDPDDSSESLTNRGYRSANKNKADQSLRNYKATFEYQLESLKPLEGMAVLTGTAAVQEINFNYDEAGWNVLSSTAVQVEAIEAANRTQAKVLLGLGSATLLLKPKARDVTIEETQFFVEASNLYLPSPGVVDGVHRLHIRVSQGQVNELNVIVPKGLTVSAVNGPVGSWQFDADSGRLKLAIEPSQSQAFDVTIETQRGLETLPTDLKLTPLQVEAAFGEVGLVGIAFGPDAQPEKVETKSMSAVNTGDFDASMIVNKQAVLHRVYRYGAGGGELSVRVAPVEPEVRVISKQVLSLGDERVVLAVNFTAEIARAGLFQLSFPLPKGLEVESLTGAALHHWAELTEGDSRQIVLHLNGKTLGPQSFSLTLAGNTPTEVIDWEIPRFELKQSTRQSGELVVRPTTGIRLRTVTRQNVSETDPRTMGGEAQGSLAFRLLQRDWKLTLGIEKLDPWITGQVLHEVTLREGQTRSALIASFQIQNASIRSLQVALPITDSDEIKTLRASGDTVSDFVRLTPKSNVWEVQLKRRVVGKIEFRIEYERRGDRVKDSELLSPVGFPQARQLAYFMGVRAGGRLELEHDALPQGWQRIDWSTVPGVLREKENRSSPAFALRAVSPAKPLVLHAKRHSLADALKLRVAEGSLTTVLSPKGDQLTAVDVTIEVIQRSSLSVGLPKGGQLFSIFVNGESVHSIRHGGDLNAWQFYILPGINDRTAKVRFVYSVPGVRLSHLKLTSPELNVPLENIKWNVVAPKGFELIDNDGNLELVSETNQGLYDRTSYLSKASGKRQVQAEQAVQLLEQANQFLQAGEQTKARWALNSVANQYALDAASNEDARVQLENLQTQQAIVGLNTRRQRLYLDNNRNDITAGENKQLREAAADNPILQQDQINFRPQQLNELLRGNSSEDNAILQQIAGRLVQHQHTTDPAPQAILISLPEEGSVYTFSRSVQVAENAPLELNLEFASQLRRRFWESLAVIAILAIMATVLTSCTAMRLQRTTP